MIPVHTTMREDVSPILRMPYDTAVMDLGHFPDAVPSETVF